MQGEALPLLPIFFDGAKHHQKKLQPDLNKSNCLSEKMFLCTRQILMRLHIFNHLQLRVKFLF
jgi:hypothetical protein